MTSDITEENNRFARDRQFSNAQSDRLKRVAFIAYEAYGFDERAIRLGMGQAELRERVMRADRGAVATEWRGKGVVDLLQAAAERHAGAVGCGVLVAAVASDNGLAIRAWLEGLAGAFSDREPQQRVSPIARIVPE